MLSAGTTPSDSVWAALPARPSPFYCLLAPFSYTLEAKVAASNIDRMGVQDAQLLIEMFADDFLLFGVATEDQTVCMLGCLDKFSKASRGKINHSKSLKYLRHAYPRHIQ